MNKKLKIKKLKIEEIGRTTQTKILTFLMTFFKRACVYQLGDSPKTSLKTTEERLLYS
jgi:hypothetical protein